MNFMLRAGLLGGLVLHKLVWEVLKDRKSGDPAPAPSSEGSPRLKAVKAVKISVLGGLLLQTALLNVLPLRSGEKSRRLTWLGLALYVTGLTTAIVGRLQLGKNWANIEEGQVLNDQKLVSHGIYGYIRHPIYIGDVLLVTGLELALGSWLFLLGAPLLALVTKQAISEEALLSKSFPGYEAYRQRTRRFIPLLF